MPLLPGHAIDNQDPLPYRTTPVPANEQSDAGVGKQHTITIAKGQRPGTVGEVKYTDYTGPQGKVIPRAQLRLPLRTQAENEGVAEFSVHLPAHSWAKSAEVVAASICDGKTVYVAGFNATDEGDGTDHLRVGYSGKNCVLQVTTNATNPAVPYPLILEVTVNRLYRFPKGRPTRIPVSAGATTAWPSTVVKGGKAESFPLATGKGFTGLVKLATTNCSWIGGSGDPTTGGKPLCTKALLSSKPTQASVKLLDAQGTLAERQFSVSPKRHHYALNLPVTRPTAGDVKAVITVEQDGGAPLVVHASTSQAFGVRFS